MNLKKCKPTIILLLIISVMILPKIEVNSQHDIVDLGVLEKQANKKWTFMMYNCGDSRDEEVTSSLDNSDNFCNETMYETMMNIVEQDLLPGSEVDVNIIVLHDHPYTPTDPKGHAYIYELKATSAGGKTTIADWGETNMGDGQILDDFVTFCKTYYPADNYVLSLADHGRAYAGYCYDYHAPHPHWEYAVGDCLTLNEIEDALSGSNNVSVILFNTCLGGNFETAWQLMGEVDYMLGAETTLGKNGLKSQREYCYNLSRNPNMTPREFAQMSFDVSVTPVVQNVYQDHWGTCSLYDISKFPVAGLGAPFTTAFDDFVESLHDELDFNNSQIDTFKWIRNGMSTSAMSSGYAMLVDLKDCLEKIQGNQSKFHYASVGSTAGTLLGMLNAGPDEVLMDVYNFWDENATFPAIHLQGFSICFPDSSDMFKGFLYGFMYSGLRLNIDTRWWDFLDRLFPQMVIDIYKLKDFYEIQLFKIDPSIRFDIYYEVSPEEIYHVGLNSEFQEPYFGIELGIPGSSYNDDFYGNFMVRIPTSEVVEISKAVGDGSFKVVVDASYAASATQDVNLTVKHVADDEVMWQESQTHDIEIGQTLTTIVSLDDSMTEFEVDEVEIPTSEIGMQNTFIPISIFSFIIFLLVVNRKKNKLKK
ncbi:MAG: clostripain-related cysteine peptidase [Candidatus Heimdallarchaeota archaeon]